MATGTRTAAAVKARPPRTEQLSMRVAPEEKAVLQRAAQLERQTVTEFVLLTARREAERIVSEHQALQLSERDSRAFMDAILNLPAYAPRLQQALERHAERYGDA